ncbi:sigma-54 factor interaction domain-containing protein [Gemmatirosa kalamazoonensis]|uniref:Sigma-54 factor interaction domain-containing protein n=1 Tax=Gemmatirosa kalamazoonensis TaxID=861299 RepID=W0RM06_9BACT|nr:sigma-54 dependent transcriptional regulator [Gemmatirosa kalamazoonensis]AHG91492.1 sigma-54 factor interaction domain-containing protein [Gemmatirosa kalamazoonensis]
MSAPRTGRSAGGARDAERAYRAVLTLSDVEPAVRINALLEAAGLATEMVSPLDDIRAVLRRGHPDVVILTGALLDPHNLSLVRHLSWDGVPAVGLTDVSDPQTTARLREAGYARLYPKPIVPEEVADGVRRLLERRRLQEATGLIGESEAIQEVLVKVEQIAPVTSTVLIDGESGTGKELVARAIHRLSPRRGKPFIAVNVGALPETLLESELFGHEKGAFTGAAERRLGRFELADGGTLFLDEIGEIPPATQVKLLRVLEEREVTRLGAAQPIEVDVRVVAATNRPLREHVMEGTFRADLFYRLDVLRIYLPPLRERRSDIPLLVRRFVAEYAARHDRPFHGIAADAMALLVDYPWPGNVRELRNLIESMVVLAPGREIRPEDLPRHLREGSEVAGARLLPVAVGPMVRDGERAQGRELEFIVRSLLELKLQVEELRRRLDEERAAQRASREIAAPSEVPLVGVAPAVAAIEARETAPPPNVVTISPGMTMAEIERLAIEAALRETGGNRRRAAELLGIGERTLYRKLHEYQLPESATSE